MTEVNAVDNGKVVGETFEQWINRTMGQCDVEVATEIKALMKLRDSGRVCFLENKKKYENTEDVLGNGKLPEAEVVIAKADLVKFADRARKYLARYDYATRILKAFRDTEAKQKAIEKADKAMAEAHEANKATEATSETLTDATKDGE